MVRGFQITTDLHPRKSGGSAVAVLGLLKQNKGNGRVEVWLAFL